MPNWNQTKYVFTGSKDEIGKFNEIIMKSLSNENLKSGDFGNDWLGFIVKEINENPNEVDCRGWIENPKLINNSTLKFTTYTAWSSCFELFELICKKFPSLNYYFISTEDGCCVYLTNDKEKKYFKYGKKYEIIDKGAIQEYIEMEKKMKEMVNYNIPSDSIYLRVAI